ncbi:hypothetical protein B0T39_00925 [Chromobacterium haemolyticum]|nr:hypothetical protein B0T39_00925 [Chromobacterium haemolyticum]
MLVNLNIYTPWHSVCLWAIGIFAEGLATLFCVHFLLLLLVNFIGVNALHAFTVRECDSCFKDTTSIRALGLNTAGG